jgi:starch phosphorylase
LRWPIVFKEILKLDQSSLRSGLERLATSHVWTWTPSCRDLLDSLPGAGGRHPCEVVARLDDQQLESLLADGVATSLLADELARLNALGEPSPPRIAYCSPEFGISGLLPQYAGGLGVLAGDHLKAASDMGLPLVGVGLFYRDGVFHQNIEDGRQVETYHSIDPNDVGARDSGITVSVPLPGREVVARVWLMEVGRVRLVLLDTDVDANSADDRNITDQLYIGFGQHRVEQEMILGVGGARALAGLDWHPEVFHLNEGHAGFAALELIDRLIGAGTVADAVAKVSPGVIFTTHTPVPAGIDRFDRDLLEPYLTHWAERWDAPVGDLWALGVDPDDESRFNMAAWCLRIAGSANGVSALHGEVSRGLFAGVGLGDEIGSVTNGVHARTWTGSHMQTLFDEALGDAWAAGDPEAWGRVVDIDDGRLTEARHRSSLALTDHVAATTGQKIDPDALIIGFARRFAPYKRATLLLRDPERLGRLLADDGRPVHFLFSGKAHPSDEAGKSLVAQIVGYSGTSGANARVTFLADYDMEIAYHLVQGCDIWLNNPIRPREASGTSGEKVALNGGLNCSILDGWWAEMYDGHNGWAIPASLATDMEQRDTDESASVLETIESIRDEFYGARHVFNGRIRHAWRTLGPRVTATRMLTDYQNELYQPALERVAPEPA